MVKTDFFRVAVSGSTLTGMEMKEQWLIDIVELYDPEIFGARLNVEHIQAFAPGNEMNAKGDVVAVQLRKEKIAGEMKTCLYAQVKPNSALLQMIERGEKVYPSIEVLENFASTGRAYLVGIGLTDRPESLGTQPLKFSSKKETKQFSQKLETTITLENNPMPQATPTPETTNNTADTATPTVTPEGVAPAATPAAEPSAFSAAIANITDKLNIFSAKSKFNDANVQELVGLVGNIADTFTEAFSAMQKQVDAAQAEAKTAKEASEKLAQEFSALNATEVKSTRPVATGAEHGKELDNDF